MDLIHHLTLHVPLNDTSGAPLVDQVVDLLMIAGRAILGNATYQPVLISSILESAQAVIKRASHQGLCSHSNSLLGLGLKLIDDLSAVTEAMTFLINATSLMGVRMVKERHTFTDDQADASEIAIAAVMRQSIDAVCVLIVDVAVRSMSQAQSQEVDAAR